MKDEVPEFVQITVSQEEISIIKHFLEIFYGDVLQSDVTKLGYKTKNQVEQIVFKLKERL